MPPVGLQLAFPRAPGADAAAQPGHSRALAREPRQQIFQLSKLHLQLARAGYGVLGKNIQNELGAVHDLALGDVRQVVQLGRGQLAVKNQHVRPALQGLHLQLRHFALAQNKARIDLGYALHHAPGHGQPGRVGQSRQFVQVAFLH